MNLADLARNFSTEDAAIAFLESKLWPDGPICPKCGLIGEAYHIQSKPQSKTKVRPGLWKCKGCRKPFRVTVNTIFEDSHIPLHKWLLAIHLMCASKKGMSAHQLHRMLGLGYRAAWFMGHRIRYAMTHNTFDKPLEGTVEGDETYVGGKVRGKGGKAGKENKAPVVSLVERQGNVRSFHVANVTAATLRPILKEHISEQARLNTDDAVVYRFSVPDGIGHDVIDHSKRVYSRIEEGRLVTRRGLFQHPKARGLRHLPSCLETPFAPLSFRV